MLAIFLFEVKYYIRNTKELIQFIGLYFSVIFFLSLGISSNFDYYHNVNHLISSIALIVSVNISIIGLFQRDGDSGRLDYYQLADVALEGVVLAKWAAYALCVLLPLLIALPFTALLMRIPPTQWLHYGVGTAGAVVALSILGALSAAMLTGLDKAGATLSLMTLPLTIPVLIFTSSYLASSGEIFSTNLFFILGFIAFMLPILCFAGASCIRSSN